MKAVLEGILFVVGDEGVTINDICNILEINEEDAKKLVLELKNDYLDCNRGLRIDYLGNSIKLTTKKEHKEYYKKLIEEKNNVLSQAALETLAIIVYNEPITRIKVDEIRGVSSAQKNVVKIHLLDIQFYIKLLMIFLIILDFLQKKIYQK